MEMVMDGEDDAALPNPRVPQPRALRCSPRDLSPAGQQLHSPCTGTKGQPGGTRPAFGDGDAERKEPGRASRFANASLRGFIDFFFGHVTRRKEIPWGKVPLETCSAPGVRRQQREMPDPTAP